jgi:WD40 repeat protein
MQEIALAPDRKRVAAAPMMGPTQDKVIRVWDLEQGTTQVIGPLPGAGEGEAGGVFGHLAFVGPDRLLAAVEGKPILFDLREGGSRVLSAAITSTLFVSRSGGFGLGRAGYPGELVRFALDTGAPVPLPGHGREVTVATMDPTETLLATGSVDGTVRIGPASGGEPYLFFGHKGNLFALAFSPDGRWLASGGEDLKIRLWPVPDMTKPPLHTLPHDALLRRLRTFTNLRAIRDSQSVTGYKLEIGPFPGWATTPEW